MEVGGDGLPWDRECVWGGGEGGHDLQRPNLLRVRTQTFSFSAKDLFSFPKPNKNLFPV